MILIPEIETVVILTPRTGSGSTRRAILAKYPRAMMVYRHMEADGVPHGYDRWTKVGVVREPVERLWSLYKFLRTFGGEHDPAYIERMRGSAERPFSDWIVNNDVPFTTPYDSAGLGRFFPGFTVHHPLPENRKSQYVYLRPDLGTQVYQFTHLDQFASRLGIKLSKHNATSSEPTPILTMEAADHVRRFFQWDVSATIDCRAA